MPLDETKEAGDFGHLGDHDALHERYNNSVEVRSGTTAARPAATAVDAGTLYWDTDAETLHRSNGTTWDDLTAGASDHGALTGLADDDHPQYALDTDLTTHEGAADPHPGYVTTAEGATLISNHEGAADPHTGYRLESADHSHASTGLQAGTIDHGVLTGLTDDDHTQYIPKSVVDAAGDILVGTADNTVGRLGVGSNGDVLTLAAGTPAWAAPSGGGDLVYSKASLTDLDVSETSDVTIATTTVTVAAGDMFEIEAWLTFLHNPGLASNQAWTLTFGGITAVFDAQSGDSSWRRVVRFHARVFVSATNLAEMSAEMLHPSSPANEDSYTSELSKHMFGWDRVTTDETGTKTVSLKVRNSTGNANPTQDVRLHSFTIRQYQSA